MAQLEFKTCFLLPASGLFTSRLITLISECFFEVCHQCAMAYKAKRPNLSKGAYLLVVKEGLEPSTPGL